MFLQQWEVHLHVHFQFADAVYTPPTNEVSDIALEMGCKAMLYSPYYFGVTSWNAIQNRLYFISIGGV